MAVADLIKLIPESSLRGHSTSHVVGLLSVLAISGSVALLTLAGKLKLSSSSSHEQEPPKMDGRDESRTSSAPSKRDGKDDGGKRRRVHFAEDVREPRGDSREYRLRFAHRAEYSQEEAARHSHSFTKQMPANRVALYRGLRQHRLQQHFSSSY